MNRASTLRRLDLTRAAVASQQGGRGATFARVNCAAQYGICPSQLEWRGAHTRPDDVWCGASEERQGRHVSARLACQQPPKPRRVLLARPRHDLRGHSPVALSLDIYSRVLSHVDRDCRRSLVCRRECLRYSAAQGTKPGARCMQMSAEDGPSRGPLESEASRGNLGKRPVQPERWCRRRELNPHPPHGGPDFEW